MLDLSETIAGQYCARLLGDFGAKVFLLEPPGGSAIRKQGPFGPAPDASSLLFFHLNTGKHSVAFDGDQAKLSELAASADIAIVGNSADAAIITQANPNAIVAIVTGFGTEGPYSDWGGGEMLFQAMSGMMVNNGAEGLPPLYGCGHRASYAAGVAAYCGVLAAVHERSRSGLGQVVDIAIAEIAAAMTTSATAYNYSGISTAGRGRGDGQVQCRGEWVTLWIYPNQWNDFCVALDVSHLLEDPRFSGIETRQANWAELMAVMQAHLADWPADEVVSRLQARRPITAKAASLTDLAIADAHLRAREYWEQVETPAGPKRVLGPPFRLKATPRVKVSDAPRYGDTPAPAPRSRPAPQAAVPPADTGRTDLGGPLHGLRVLELTTAWAGPMAGRVLAFLGADVIHVEHATRVDLWRHHRQPFRPSLYPGGDGGARPYNRNALFNSQNINKRSLTLDIKAPAGLAVARELAATCHIVLANFTPGALDRAGLGYESLRAINPSIIVCEMPAYGLSGPRKGAPAVGITMEMASGMASLIGYRDGRPTGTGPNYMDPIGGLNATAAILTALAYRQRTGEGQFVEVPQVEAAMQFIGEELLNAAARGENPVRDGNHVRHAAPHDVFPALGDDQWVAIAVADDAAWRALCAIAAPALRDDPRFATLAQRLAHQDELLEPIASWTRRHSKVDAADLLQRAGVAAAPVLEAKDVAQAPYYRDRQFFSRLEHREAGCHDYHTVPIRLSRTPGGDRRAAPCLGQDTETILSEILGLTQDQIEVLAADGVTSALPT